MFHCRPLHKAWQVYPDPGSKCELSFGLAVLAANVVVGECTAGYTLYPIVLSLNVVYVPELATLPQSLLSTAEQKWNVHESNWV
jgi:hypothetical protein